MVEAEGWLAALQPVGAWVAKLGGHCTDKGQHCFVHEGAKTWAEGAKGHKAPAVLKTLLNTQTGGTRNLARAKLWHHQLKEVQMEEMKRRIQQGQTSSWTVRKPGSRV